MAKTRRVLVTGGTGLLGKGMVETAPAGWSILSLHQRPYRVTDPGVRHVVLDIREKGAVDRLFSRNAFDLVIHAAGIASVDYVESNYAESLESNLVGTLNIVSACRRWNRYMVYVSTNAVFDGRKPPYRETDPVRPVNKYGRLKVECERLATEALKDFSIARPILMYGWGHASTRPNMVTWVCDKLRKGEGIKVVDDVHENPLHYHQCGRAMWALARLRPQGIFHLAGRDAVSRCEFALRVAEVFGLDARLIARVKSSAFPGIAPRPPNTTFVTERMRRILGVKPIGLTEGLLALKRSEGRRA